MDLLKSNFSELNGYLSSVISNLDEINNENFDRKMHNINTLIEHIEKKRVYLLNNYSLDVLKTNCDAANSAVKQINSRFDSIIESKKEQQKLLSSELAKIVNKKKLINYQR